MNQKYWVIIPVLNEEESLPKTISSLQNLSNPPSKIITVDNGSTDDSLQVARDLGAFTLEEPNRGYGNACLMALSYIRELEEINQPDYLVFMDADGSDNPLDIDNLLNPLRETDLANDKERIISVIGSRTLGDHEKGSLGFLQRFGNRLSCFLLKIMLQAKFTDLGPLRAIRTKNLLSMGMKDKNYGWTVEWQTRLVLNNLTYKEIPVSYKNREKGKSKVSGSVKGSFLAGIKILSVIFSLYTKDRLPKMQNAPWVRFLFLSHILVFTALFLDKTQSLSLIIAFSIGFFILLFPYPKKNSFKAGTFYLWTGLLIRFPLIFILPLLSDDFYRTIWDAQVILQGFNPYAHTPFEIFTRIQTAPAEYLNSWIHLPYYEKLNSQNFHSFYPPLQHLISVFAVLLGNISFGNFSNLGPYKSMIGLKILFFIFEWSNLFFLRKLLKNRTENLKFYAWNPLIIMEGIGNLHFEIPMTTSMLVFFWLLQKNKFISGLALASSVWTKLLPILLIPNLLFSTLKKSYFSKPKSQGLLYIFVPSLIAIFLWLFLVWSNYSNQWDHGIGLYSHSFEFFSFFNWWGRIALARFGINYQLTGLFFWIGFLVIYILFLSLSARKNLSLEKVFFLILSLVFFFSPVLHPWYLIPWVTLGIILGIRSAIIGSFLILSSYSYYHTPVFLRNELIVSIAYFLFFTFMIWEIYEYKFNWNRSRSPRRSFRNFH